VRYSYLNAWIMAFMSVLYLVIGFFVAHRATICFLAAGFAVLAMAHLVFTYRARRRRERDALERMHQDVEELLREESEW
jgi:uncharacterized membrane protein